MISADRIEMQLFKIKDVRLVCHPQIMVPEARA